MTEQKAKEIIEEVKVMDENLTQYMTGFDEALEMSMSALDKQIPKKPKHPGCYDNEGVWHEWNGINGRPYELCPNCETNLCCEMPYDKKPNYCKDCGQKLDWSD